MKREPGARMHVLRAPYALENGRFDKYLIGDQVACARWRRARSAVNPWTLATAGVAARLALGSRRRAGP